MNDPWSNLIQSLSGTSVAGPEWWPARRVHRALDDAEPPPTRRSAGPREKPRVGNVGETSWPSARSPTSPKPFKCTCTNCRAQAAAG
jgi:hypothetical protein